MRISIYLSRHVSAGFSLIQRLRLKLAPWILRDSSHLPCGFCNVSTPILDQERPTGNAATQLNCSFANTMKRLILPRQSLTKLFAHRGTAKRERQG